MTLAAYFLTNKILKNAATKNIQKTEIFSKTHFVDSLLVVVDSLTVQVDSLNRLEDHIIYIPKVVDTAFIIQQYYSKLKQTIKHRDSNLYLKLAFDLQKNKVLLPKLEYKILQPKTVFKMRTVRKNSYFFGASFGGSLSGIQEITPKILLVKTNHAITLGYNLLDNQANIHLGYYFKIR
ncbi:hypothetical protein VQ01_13105 [Tamlana sp. s12]|nr:hypothetical protein VQ01_13105 [Tamlana sp. s12]